MTSTPGGLGDYGTAAAFREVIRRMVREEMNSTRPPDRFGRAISKSVVTLKCTVVLTGDTEAITVNMSPGCMPTFTDAEDGVNNGSMVRVSGTPGNYWITQICSGPEFGTNTNLYKPRIAGGDSGQRQIETYDTVDGGLPALGNAWHLGRWDNTASSTSPALSILEVVLTQNTLTSEMKRYTIPLRNNATGGVWAKCVAEIDSGAYSAGQDFELEILVDTTGFELRVRRTAFDAGGLPNSGYYAYIRIIGEEWKKASAGTGEVSGGVPALFVNANSSAYQKGPFVSPGMNLPDIASQFMFGGTDIVYASGAVSWSVPFRISGVGLNHMLPGGFLDISVPGSGVAIPVFGSNTVTTVNTTASGIPLADGQALYYEPVWGSSSTGSTGTNFRIVDRTHTTRFFQVPSSWIPICKREFSTLQLANRQVPGLFAVASGQATATFTAAQSVNVTVTLPAGRFSQTPSIGLAANTGLGIAIGSTFLVLSASTTSFQFQLRLTAVQTTAINVMWTAIQSDF